MSVRDPFASLDDDLRGALVKGTPEFVEPMKARLSDQAFSDPAWLFEVKLDGVRALAVRDGDAVSLFSRREKLQNTAYPEVVEAVGALDRDQLVLDGEVVAFDGARTSFQKLQNRMGIQSADQARRSGIAVYYYVFDLLHLDGSDTSELPLRDRKSLLKQAVVFEDPLRYATHRNERGEELFEAACQRGWEGLIAKRATSPYKPGSRSRDWLKLKCLRRQEFVIGGFTDPKGSRTGFGAILVGYHDDDGELRYAGKVGTGFTEQVLTEMRSAFNRLERETSPFADQPVDSGVHWVTPKLVGEVGFSEWTNDGKLRQPRFEGLRDDKDPADVVRE